MASSKVDFLILGKKSQEVDRLVIQLKTISHYETAFESSPDAALLLMATRTFDCLILVLDNFGFRQYRLIEQIRNLGYKFKIFIFADQIHAAAEKVVESMHEVVIFGKNYIDIENDFLGICSRFVSGKVSVKRVAKRKSTWQKAMVNNVRTGHHFSCTVHNMSEGGAYIEYHGGALNLGDKIKITVHLSHLRKTHVVKAEVTWLKISPASIRSAGLKFVK